ncbi:MAG: hypothetical protein M3R61_20075 [Chloroflexota bacterium]|nr:hypothetical protein [Chloroflexota bacterium]
MNQNRYPPGWDDKKVREVITHYDAQTEEEAITEAEAAFQNQTMMEVPTELVPFVRGLIGLRQAAIPNTDTHKSRKSTPRNMRRI